MYIHENHKESTLAANTIAGIPKGKQQKIVVNTAQTILLDGLYAGDA